MSSQQIRRGSIASLVCRVIGHDWHYSGFDSVTCSRCSHSRVDEDISKEVLYS